MAAGKGDTIICASCQAQLPVKSDLPGQIVCGSCFALIDKAAKTVLKKVAAVAEDMAVIQTGSTGKLPDHTSFEVIGRYKIDADDGYYNLWFTISAKNQTGWIIDSFGDYIYAPATSPEYKSIPEEFWNSDCNSQVSITDKGSFTLMAKPKITGQEIEGEIPEMPEAITNCRVYELADADGKQALLIKDAKNNLICLGGSITPWQSWHFENIRNAQTIGK